MPNIWWDWDANLDLLSQILITTSLGSKICIVLYCVFIFHVSFHKSVLHWKNNTRSCCPCCLVTKLSLTFCDHMDRSSSGSFVHGISKARRLEYVAISFSRGCSQLRDRIHVSCFGRWILYHWHTCRYIDTYIHTYIHSQCMQMIMQVKAESVSL